MPSFIGFFPTPHEYIDAFFELAPVSPSDVVYDLGSGDGRLLFAALERGAGRAVGVDLDPERIRVAREIARSKGLESKVTFIEADLMDVSLADDFTVLSKASVNTENAAGGVYLSWIVSGPVNIEARKQAGFNVVLSGVFVDHITTKDQ